MTDSMVQINRIFGHLIVNAFLSIRLYISLLQCYSVLSDILVNIELWIPLERGSNVLSSGKDFICLSPLSKLKFAVRFCSIYTKPVQCYSVLSD